MIKNENLSKVEQIKLYRSMKKRDLAEMLYESNRLLSQLTINNQPYHYTIIKNCLHDGCLNCQGSGVKHDGSMCIHNISCSCSKCSPTYFTRFSVTNNID